MKELLLNFTNYRNGGVVDENLLKDAIECYVIQGLKTKDAKPVKSASGIAWEGTRNIEFYEKEFETQFLENAKSEYAAKGEQWIATCSAPEYLQNADDAFNHEEQKSAKIFLAETKPKLVRILKRELVTLRAELVANKETGCNQMFGSKRVEDLKLMYKVFSRDEATLPILIRAMSTDCYGRGTTLVRDEAMLKEPIKLIEELLK